MGLCVQIGLIFFTDIFNGFVAGFEERLVQPEYAMVGILAFFALVHSGLAFLRPYGVVLVLLLSHSASQTTLPMLVSLPVLLRPGCSHPRAALFCTPEECASVSSAHAFLNCESCGRVTYYTFTKRSQDCTHYKILLCNAINGYHVAAVSWRV